jgi:uncharacterized protein (TIRG00374 family)
MFISIVGLASNWAIILRGYGISIRFNQVINLYLQALFINNFASFIGGDVVRGYRVGKTTEKMAEATISVVLSRLVMLYTLGVLTGISLWLWAGDFGWGRTGQWVGTLLCVLLLIPLFMVVWINANGVDFLKEPIKRIGSMRVQQALNQTAALFSEKSQIRHLFVACIISFFAQLVSVWSVWLLVKGLNIAISWWQLILVLSLVGIALVLPISFNGLGIRESGMVGLLPIVGVNSTEALALSLLSSLIIIVVSFVGGIAMLKDIFLSSR